MSKLNVKTELQAYNIIIEDSFDALKQEMISSGLSNKKIGIITDHTVGDIYAKVIQDIINEISDEVYVYAFKPGEISKNFNTIQDIYRFLLENNFDRHSCLIALGGGVVGDMTGFVASTYMRGIKYVQVPTSLLAQVDSSVGGKTGYDFMGYKNIIGAFYQPSFVFVNVNTLKTLETKQFNSGMAEVIKHGLIADGSYYEFIVKNKEAIKALDPKVITDMIYRSCEIKANVVSQDEKESGIRKILNFGHTIGHAVESLYNFQWYHGECVAIGMIGELKISKAYGLNDEEQLEQSLVALLKFFDLPVEMGQLSKDDLFKSMNHDKKNQDNKISFVLLSKLGESYATNDVHSDQIHHVLEQLMK